MWILFGISAVVSAMINIVWYFRKKNGEIFRFLSISLTALTMCAFYSQSSQWVIAEDWSALLDVVPTMSASNISVLLPSPTYCQKSTERFESVGFCKFKETSLGFSFCYDFAKRDNAKSVTEEFLPGYEYKE